MKAFLYIILFSLISCSGRNVDEGTRQELPTSKTVTLTASEQELYDASRKLFEDRMFTVAIDTLQSLINNYPTGAYLEFAKVKLADCHFNMKEYQTTISIAESFLVTHPLSSSAPYMAYLAARSSYLLYGGAGRDLSPILRAREYYEKITNEFPDSIYFHKARNEITKIDLAVADHYKFIIDYYNKREKFQIAEEREKEYAEYVAKLNVVGIEQKKEISDGISLDQAKQLILNPRSIAYSESISRAASFKTKNFNNNFVSAILCQDKSTKSIIISFSNLEIDKIKTKLIKDYNNKNQLSFNLEGIDQNEYFDCFGDSIVKVDGNKILYPNINSYKAVFLNNPARLVLVDVSP